MVDHGSDSIPVTPDEYMDDSNPVSPSESSEASTPFDMSSNSPDGIPGMPQTTSSSPIPNSDFPRRVPSLRTASDPQHSSHMNPSSSVSGILNSVRRPPPSANNIPIEFMQKARALQQQRQNMSSRPSLSTQSSGSGMSRDSPISGGASPIGGMGAMGGMGVMGGMNMGGRLPGGVPANMGLPPGLSRPVPPGFPKSAPVVPTGMGGKKGPSLSERRAMRLGGLPGSASPVSGSGTPKLSDLNGRHDEPAALSLNGEGHGSKMNDFKNYIDAEKGWITFEGTATIMRTGVKFANGQTFSISLDEIQPLGELGKGNYGTVYKVRHAKPSKPRFGPNLTSFRAPSRESSNASEGNASPGDESPASSSADGAKGASTGVIMAMKELRLELDEAKFTTILKELLILHECVSPYIIDFYGAFFQEGAVYMCIEYMDGGSIDKLYAGGIPEPVLRKITYATVMGLKMLKDLHNIIHRDVKPTNILVNRKGQVKICDFGVSGHLVASIAKTNIGCQSYMAPERISGGDVSAAGNAAGGTYSVQSDIWSLGLTIIECAMGRYPYPPEVSNTIFSQLNAIVEGDPPKLPQKGYSPTAQDFVRCCLQKLPANRHTYSMLLAHAWMQPLTKPETIAEDAEAEDAAAESSLVNAAGNLTLENMAVGDAEVAAWVQEVLDRKSQGGVEKGGAKVGGKEPALHHAPLSLPAVS